MRQPRIKLSETSFYHCLSRTVEDRRIFPTRGPSPEAEYFVALMRRLERGCGVRVLTYALMGNHFHILCQVPQRRSLPDEELLACVAELYGPARRDRLAQELSRLREKGRPEQGGLEALRQSYLARLFDLSVFLKELKGRFAQWYNQRHGRWGALWTERFKSLLVEPGSGLQAVAAYIDLNPLRAGLCLDPKDYRYCGYGEAIARDSARARAGLKIALGFGLETAWKRVGKDYRKLLFCKATQASKPGWLIDERRAREVIEVQGGQIPLPELLRCRLRSLIDGGILGSQRFIQEQMAKLKRPCPPLAFDHRHRFFHTGAGPIYLLRPRRYRAVL
jgi:putative transposase